MSELPLVNGTPDDLNGSVEEESMKMILLIYYALGCLVLAVAVPLSAQQKGPPTGQRVPPTSPVPKQATPSPAHSLGRRCGEFLASPLLSPLLVPEERRMSTIEQIFPFQAAQDDELVSDIALVRRCIELPSIRVRQAAFDAYGMLLDEQNIRTLRAIDASWGRVLDEEKEKQKAQQVEIEKQRADFTEVANFAAALEKQKQEYLSGAVKCIVDYVELQDRYRAAYSLADEAIHLAQEVTRTRLSLPAFVNEPAPQVIRVEAPAVPRSLHCTANTMPPPAPGLATWTWTDCHW